MTFRNADDMIRFLCARYGVSKTALCGESRHRKLVRLRWAIMFALDHFGWSSVRIGAVLGDRDHTTCLYGIKQGEGLVLSDPDFRSLVFTLVNHEWPSAAPRGFPYAHRTMEQVMAEEVMELVA